MASALAFCFASWVSRSWRFLASLSLSLFPWEIWRGQAIGGPRRVRAGRSNAANRRRVYVSETAGAFVARVQRISATPQWGASEEVVYHAILVTSARSREVGIEEGKNFA